MSPLPRRTPKHTHRRAGKRSVWALAPLLCAALALGFTTPAVDSGAVISGPAAQRTEPATLSPELSDYLSAAPATEFPRGFEAALSNAPAPEADPAPARAAAPNSAPDEAWVDAKTGRIEVIVYFTDQGVTAASQGDPALAATALQQDADAHWDTIDRRLSALTESGRIEVLNRFWVTSAVLVSAEATDRTLADLAALPGAIEVTPNYTVEPLDDTIDVLPEVRDTPDTGDVGATPSTAEATDDPVAAEAADASAAAADAETAALAAAEPALTYGLEKIGADDAWRDFGARGQGVRVAVLDTGIDASHPDIGSRLVGRGTGDPSYPGGWINFDRTGKPLVTKPTDPGSHGTHVAGTILGGSASGTSIGVAPDAELMAANVLSGGGSTAKILAALEWVISPTDGTGAPAGRAADVINMSLGSGGFEHQLARAIRNVRDAGIFPAIAIGNKAGTTSAPGNYFEAVAVGMTNAEDQVDRDSSGGVMTWGSAITSEYGWPESFVKPDISAPGVRVLSAMPGGKYGEATGTSMATPHVAGAVALLRSAQAGLSVTEIEDALERTAWHPNPESGPDIGYGHGRIDVHAAISAVLGESGVKGQVVNAGSGAPVSGATVSFAERGETWTTDVQGRFTARLAPGSYSLTVQRFGYETAQTAAVTVTANGFTELSIPVTQITVGSLTGTVLDHRTSAPIAGATVSLVGTELTATTDAQGAYRFDALPIGAYQVRAVADDKAAAMSAAAPVKAALTTTVKFRLADLSSVLVLGDATGRTAALLADNGFAVEARPALPANLAELGAYDAVLWDAPTGDASRARIQEAIAETDASGTGILWLDLGVSEHSGLAALSRALGDPADRSATDDRSASAVGYRITAEHEILAGGLLSPDALQPGSIVVQNSATAGPKFAAWFGALTGSTPTVIAETVVQHTDTTVQPNAVSTTAQGSGLAVDQRAKNRHAYLALHGSSPAVDARNWSPASAQLLLNTVKWAAPVALQAPEPEIWVGTPPVITPPVVVPPIVNPPVVTPPKPGTTNGTRGPGENGPVTVPANAAPAGAPAGGVASSNAGGSTRAPASQAAPKPDKKPAAPVQSARDLTADNAGGITSRITDGIAYITIPKAQAGDWFFLHVYPNGTPVDWIRVNDEGELRIDISKLTRGSYQFAFTSSESTLAGWVEIVISGTAQGVAAPGLVDEPTQLSAMTPAPGGGLTLSAGEQLMLLGSALLILAAAGLVLFGPRKRQTPAAVAAV
ncbi:S8 family serine peptidase [Leucobacter luti]|uniref:S8 family serine peptidase n=1 Tax=Leucobacter luti TaxID=340320 RepID=UPI001C687D6B|nr:S8 family serine peptidase [Leucobacter luti]QYM77032.1 S8 family serine peptidase [Leucobacter luti]